MHCASIVQALEVFQLVALLRQFAQAQTASYCIAHAQTGQHCRTVSTSDANGIPDLQGHSTFFCLLVFT